MGGIACLSSCQANPGIERPRFESCMYLIGHGLYYIHGNAVSIATCLVAIVTLAFRFSLCHPSICYNFSSI